MATGASMNPYLDAIVMNIKEALGSKVYVEIEVILFDYR